jgi:DNA-binding NtrC family response regulator
MERVAAVARHPVVAGEDLAFLDAQEPGPGQPPDWCAGTLPEALARLEAAMIRRALTLARGNRSEAARSLGIHRQLLHEKMKRHGLG